MDELRPLGDFRATDEPNHKVGLLLRHRQLGRRRVTEINCKPVRNKQKRHRRERRGALTTARVYSPVASDPWELICAMSKQPRPRGFPTALRPFTTPGPGTAWAFTMWDQEEIWYNPPGKWMRKVKTPNSSKGILK